MDLEKDFIGADALRKIAQSGPRRLLIGLFIEGPRSARQGMNILAGQNIIGIVTSAAASPTLKRSIALAYVDIQHALPGTQLTLDLRGTPTPATVTPLPFYKRPK